MQMLESSMRRQKSPMNNDFGEGITKKGTRRKFHAAHLDQGLMYYLLYKVCSTGGEHCHQGSHPELGKWSA